MKHYAYYELDKSSKRGYNRTVVVFEIKNNIPLWIGTDDEIDTAAWKGAMSVACHVIHQQRGHKLSPDGYTLLSKNIRVYGL